MRRTPPYAVTTNLSPDVRGMAYCVRDFNNWEVAYVPGIRGQASTDDLAAQIAALPELVRALTDIRDGSAYDVAAKARAGMALKTLSIRDWRNEHARHDVTREDGGPSLKSINT